MTKADESDLNDLLDAAEEGAEPEAPASLEPVKRFKPPSVKLPKVKLPKVKLAFWREDVPENLLDERTELARIRRLYRTVALQMFAIPFFTVGLLAGTPFFQTIFQYYAVDPSQRVRRLVPLTMPNMTNRAVISWATNSITEIMTFGFGDYRPHLREQQQRFTSKGWTSFVGAFDKMKIGEIFRDRQLVLTTVPSDTAVILSQAFNEDHVYEWTVQMPIIMTYATNDNVTHREKAIVTLVISRVPPSENKSGVAIKTWTNAS